MPLRDIAAERDHGFDLRIGKRQAARNRGRRLTISMPIEAEFIRSRRPRTFAGVPGAAGFRHELEYPPVFLDDVMRRDLRRRIAQALQRRRARRHAGVVQDDRARHRSPLSP